MNTPTLRRPGLRRQAGFTLLEILVVIAILGLLVTLVAPRVLQVLGSSKEKIAKLNIEGIGGNLDTYKLDVGEYPTTEQGLAALVEKPDSAAGWSGPYVKSDHVPLDPWNHPYLYRVPSVRRGHDYDLCSGGPQAVAGDAGTTGMLCNG